MDLGHGGVGVESRVYPDFIRTVFGGEMSPSFASSSRSKRSFGVNAKTGRGIEILLEMARDTDVVIENNSTGTMDAMGLGWSAMSTANPGIVMMSSQLMGSRGTWADWWGYGPNTQVTGGMTHLWNYENTTRPAGSQSIFPDHFAGRTGAVVSMAGLLGRRRNGDAGMHAEVCQVEQVVGVMVDLLAKESLVAGSVRPLGNHSERGVPWGLFRCKGDDEWVAICVRTDLEWSRLAEVMNAPDWAVEPDLAGLGGRRSREADLDRRVGEWTLQLTKEAVTDACLAKGVAAGPMLNCRGQTLDPHFRARGFLVELDQPPIGGMTFEGAAFHSSGTTGPNIWPAPGLGEHTREIVADRIGLSPSEIEGLIEDAVLETDPPFGG